MTAYRDEKGLWRYHFELNHHRYSKRGFPTKRDANTAAEAHRAKLQQGLTGAYPTFWDLTRAYLRECARTNSREWLEQKHRKIGKWLSEWANIPPEKITPAHVLERLQAIEAAGNGPRSVNEYRTIIHAVFQFAVDLGALSRNPAHKITRIQEPQNIVPPIPTADLRKLLVAAPTWLRRFVVVQCSTGARWVQIARLQRDEVRLEGSVLYAMLRSKKTRGKERVVPQHLTAPAAEAIRAQLAEHESKYVFPGPHGRLNRKTALAQLKLACVRAEIPSYSYHRFRYWAGATMVGLGFSNKVVGRFLGHTSTTVTERYMYTADAEMVRVAEALSAQLGEIDVANRLHEASTQD